MTYTLGHHWRVFLLTTCVLVIMIYGMIGEFGSRYTLDEPTEEVDIRTLLPDEPQDIYLSKRLPQALIIGVKKAGTRALLEMLRMHPEVKAPGPEPHFFDRHYHRGLDWYRNQMPLSLPSQLTIEKTPSYFVTPQAPSRVYNMSSNIKLVLVVRDPVTRAISDYTQAMTKQVDTRTFQDLVFKNSTVAANWNAIKIGMYSKHFERWLKWFPLNRIHFVSGENLVKNPLYELKRVEKFLGLKPFLRADHFYISPAKRFPCLLKPDDPFTPHCLGKTKGRNHPKVDKETLRILRDYFRPYNKRFYKMSKKNFNWP